MWLILNKNLYSKKVGNTGKYMEIYREASLQEAREITWPTRNVKEKFKKTEVSQKRRYDCIDQILS